MCGSGPKATDPEPPTEEPRRKGTRYYGQPKKNPKRPGLWFVLLTVLVTCSGGEATETDRKLMYDWNKPTPKQKRKYLREPGGRERPPGRGTRWGGLPRPSNDQDKDQRHKPWSW